MKMRDRVMRVVGLVLFSVGILLGMALAGAAAWADTEARFYGFPELADETLKGVQCPVLMTRHETGMIRAVFTNPTNKPMNLLVRADLSSRGPAIVQRARLALDPGERQEYGWEVTADNIDLSFFIFARVAHNPAYPLRFREAMCGILVLNLPGLTGNQVFNIAFAMSLLGIPLGLALWEGTHRPLQGRSRQTVLAMAALALAVLGGLLASLMGAWAAGGLLVLLAILLISVIGYFVAND